MDDIEQRMAEADEELNRMLCDALDECQRAGAPAEELKLLAWHAGADWKPKHNLYQRRA